MAICEIGLGLEHQPFSGRTLDSVKTVKKFYNRIKIKASALNGRGSNTGPQGNNQNLVSYSVYKYQFSERSKKKIQTKCTFFGH